MAKEIKQSVLNKARGDKFRVVIPLPEVLRNKDTRLTRSNDFVNKDALDFSIYAISIPDVTVEREDVKFGGQTPRISSFARNAFDPVEIKYVLDNEFNNYWLLYSWLNLIHHESTGHVRTDLGGRINEDQYNTNIKVTGLDEYNKPKIEWTFVSAVPTSIGQFEFNYQEAHEIESTFQFQFHQLLVKIL